MGGSDQPQDGPDSQEDSASSHLGILSGRMILAVLVSPWFGVGFLYGFQQALSGAIGLGGGGAVGWQLVVMLSFMAIGPTAISLSLSPTWRGAFAAAIASFCLIFGFLPVLEVIAHLLDSLLPSLETLPFGPTAFSALGAAIPIVFALPLAGYVTDSRGYTGMFAGILIGCVLTVGYTMLAPSLRVESSGYNLTAPMVWVGLGVPFAFVWSSAIFVPELFRRRVGWAGVLVWVGLQATIFALGPLLNLLATV